MLARHASSLLFADDPAGQTNGAIAQLGERYNGIVEVSGSIPLSSTNFQKMQMNRADKSRFYFVFSKIESMSFVVRRAGFFRTVLRYIFRYSPDGKILPASYYGAGCGLFWPSDKARGRMTWQICQVMTK